MRRIYAYRRNLPHFRWTDKTYLVTFCTKNRQILTPHSRGLVLATCVAGNGRKYELHGAVVMPDHVHLMLRPLFDQAGEISIPEILQEIKSVSSHRVNKYLGRKGPLWQEESFDRAIRETDDVQGRLEYMLANPVRAGLAFHPYKYPWLWRKP